MKFCEIKVTLHSFSLLYSRSDFLTNLKIRFANETVHKNRDS